MADIIKRILEPELFFGIVAPIGADIDDTINELSDKLQLFGYRVVKIKVTDLFKPLNKRLGFDIALDETPLENRYSQYIEFGDKIRTHFSDDAFMAELAVAQVTRARSQIFPGNGGEVPLKVAYIIRQFKRKEEIELLRSIYGKLFFQVSVYSQRSSRVDNLARKISTSHNLADPIQYRDVAETLVKTDETEASDDHGQRVSDIFHEADFIISADVPDYSPKEQISRLIDLIFGANWVSPTRMEHGLYLAKSASLRSVDLSRQVGAAVLSPVGEIISMGANEVPKAPGGTYWEEDDHDDRDYKRGHDSNDRRKTEIFAEILKVLRPEMPLEEALAIEEIEKSQFMGALEYGRIIHAEMSAISDSARLGKSLKGSILYSTTFPCHMCAKHIVAAGISEVVFLEPYPKSLASDLHRDSIEIEGQSRGAYGPYPKTSFKHFFGVSPRRYRDLFEKKRRKNKKTGKFEKWKNNKRQPIMDVILYPHHLAVEPILFEHVILPHFNRAGISMEIFSEAPVDIQPPLPNQAKTSSSESVEQADQSPDKVEPEHAAGLPNAAEP